MMPNCCWYVFRTLLVLAPAMPADGRPAAFGMRRHQMLQTVLSIPSFQNLNVTKDESRKETQQKKTPKIQKDLELVENYAQEDQLLASARKLRGVLSHLNITLTPSQEQILHVADRVQTAATELSSVPDPNVWTKIAHSKKDIVAHYKLDHKRRLTARIEFLIEKPLLVPILAVLVETELYNTWVPRWRFPPVGIQHVRKLAESGRTNQVLHADLEIPLKRDIILASTGVEDVEENGLLALHLGTLEAGEEIGDTGIRVPAPAPGVVMVLLDGTFVFHKCPDNHPVLEHTVPSTVETSGEEMILVGLSLFVDPQISPLFPHWIAKFIVHVAMVRLFQIFLNVAEDVHAGRRPDHSAAIASKREHIYDWIDERVTALLHRDD